MSKITVGSVCSGIEAASVAWSDFDFKWLSEIAPFQSRLLAEKYPKIQNLGDLNEIPNLLSSEKIDAPDLICGGTPCQAFSLAGWKRGLQDERGNLTLKFVEIVEENDRRRAKLGKSQSIIFWENVEGVLKDKTNAFGCFLSYLAGCENELPFRKWPKAGLLCGPKRNVAWRILDAKYFGVPQQRRRVYVVAGGKDFFPEKILFERHLKDFENIKFTEKNSLKFDKNGQSFEVFREYTDCLESSYGTKWNGNASAMNGSLFVVEDGRLRRFTPLECERLMGFPDNYTNLSDAKPTSRFQGIGNSWVVPVIRWIGRRIENYANENLDVEKSNCNIENIAKDAKLFTFDENFENQLFNGEKINATERPESTEIGNLFDVVQNHADEAFFISPVGCAGILRRAVERKYKLNERLKVFLEKTAYQMSKEKIEQVSRIQPRGVFSETYTAKNRAVLFGF